MNNDLWVIIGACVCFLIPFLFYLIWKIRKAKIKEPKIGKISTSRGFSFWSWRIFWKILKWIIGISAVALFALFIYWKYFEYPEKGQAIVTKGHPIKLRLDPLKSHVLVPSGIMYTEVLVSDTNIRFTCQNYTPGGNVSDIRTWYNDPQGDYLLYVYTTDKISVSWWMDN